MRVLLIGIGSIARKHIAVLREIRPTVELFALRWSANAAPEPGVTSLYCWEEVLQHRYHFALISSPTACHATDVARCIALKIPLFIEKPLHYTLPQIEPVLKQVEDNQLFTYMGCNLRFLDALRFVKQEIGNRRVNEVNVYCGSYLPQWRATTDYRHSYSASTAAGGGAHLDLIHELDYLYWIFGSPISTHSTRSSRSSLDIEAVDYANYLWQYNGFCANVVLNYYRRDAKRTLEILFDDDTWCVNLLENSVTTASGKVIFSSLQRIQDTYLPQMAYFVDAIRTPNTPSLNDIYQGYNLLTLALL